MTSVIAGAALATFGCKEKRTSETAANVDANAKVDANALGVIDGGEVRVDDANDASTDGASDAASDASADGGKGADAPAHRASDGSAAATETAPHGDGGARVASLTLDEHSAGKTISLAVGQSMTLSLGASPTTGFDWSVTKAPKALGTATMKFVQGGSQMGAPGMRTITWTLARALPAGEHAVELGYARSFEKGVAPFKTFKFKVRAAH